ncbi:hypothetical protein CEXT_629261 [Caerostris extrusa]|uniref:Uncharacterized protein n=1 Tax=Caerostris extrusa TaxID=172846 RepID=A0AAV4NDK7_CAEEX|nr:hypothetical protein CEXT_629261 [Caerostris extrusa]
MPSFIKPFISHFLTHALTYRVFHLNNIRYHRFNSTCHDNIKITHLSPVNYHTERIIIPYPPVVKCRSRSGASSNVLRSQQEIGHTLEKVAPTGLSFREVFTVAGSWESIPLGLLAGKNAFEAYNECVCNHSCTPNCEYLTVTVVILNVVEGFGNI